MTINTLSVPAARVGSLLPGVVTPWSCLSGSGEQTALPMNFGPVLVNTYSGSVAPWTLAVKTLPLAVMAAGLLIDVRKQHAHKTTRARVGGDGASGPHPEREPA